MEKEVMLRKWIQKHKALINEAPDKTQRDYLVMMWVGFLNGLRVSNAISWNDYNSLYKEIQEFAEGVEGA